MRMVVLAMLVAIGCGSDPAPTPYDLVENCAGWTSEDPRAVPKRCARACPGPTTSTETCSYDPEAPAGLCDVTEVDGLRGCCTPSFLREADGKVVPVVYFIDCID